MSKALAMMPWFPRDFIAATRHFTLAERGAYRELLDSQWELGILPNDESRLARMLGVSMEEFASVWITVRTKFDAVSGGLLNKRLEDHRKKAIDGRNKKVAAAAYTNAKRNAERINSKAHSEPDSGTLSTTPPTPTPTPTKEEEIHTSTSSPVEIVFDHWRQTHGHPKARLDPKRKKIISVALKSFPQDELCRAIDGYKRSTWHQGKNDRREVFDDIELMLRDAKHVENGIKFLNGGGEHEWAM